MADHATDHVTDVRIPIDRRAALLRAAREVLAEKGLDAARVSEIVARAGVAQGTFYLYFPSKYSLVVALTEQVMDQVLVAVEEAVAGTSTLREAIAAGVTAAFRATEGYRDIIGTLHSSAGSVEIRVECERLYEPYYAYVAEMIRGGQATGEVDAAVSPELTGRLIVGLIEHAADACYVFHTETPTEDYVSEVARFIQRALGIL
ncbi:MAG TPA: TetR family transcriptional regulator [Ktedonobacterales bacterium]